MIKTIFYEKFKNCEHIFLGDRNIFGIDTRFYHSGESEVIAVFQPDIIFQGYPGRLHGGIAAAVLDETIGRAICIQNKGIWCVTVELGLVYRKPAPTGVELMAFGRVTNESRRFFDGNGELLLPDGTVAVEAKGKFFRINQD